MSVRLMAGADGHAVIDGMPYLYPLTSKRALLRSLRRAHREFRRAASFAGVADFFKPAGPLFYHFWLEWVARPPVPRIAGRRRGALPHRGVRGRGPRVGTRGLV